MKQEEIERKCLRNWFMQVLPQLQEISSNPMFKTLFGDVNSLGVEGALEACLSLYDDGILQVKADSFEDYMIYIYNEDELIMVYDTKQEEEEDDYKK